MNETFSIRKAFTYGWRATWDNALFLFPSQYIIFFLPSLIIFPLFFLCYFALGNSLTFLPVFMAYPVVNAVTRILSYLLTLPLAIGLTQIFFAIHDSKPVSYRMIFDPLRDCCLLVRAMLGTLFYLLSGLVLMAPGFIVLVGVLKRPDLLATRLQLIVFGILVVLLIATLIVWFLRSMFFYFLIIDKDRGPIRAIRDSVRLTKGHTLKLFLFFLATILLALIAAGFVMIPVTLVFISKSFQHAMMPMLRYIVAIIFSLIIYPLFIAVTGQASVYVFRKLVAR